MNNFYIFSKFTISGILLFCLIFILYVFYVNYQSQSKTENNNTLFNENFKTTIENNSLEILKISEQLNQTKLTLNRIEGYLESTKSKDTKYDDTNLLKNINIINNEIKELRKQLIEITNQTLNSKKTNLEDKPKIISDSKDQIIDLILIKFENLIDYDQELNYLEKILNKKDLVYLEKIQSMKEETYRGHIYLKNIFNEEISFFFKEEIKTDASSFINKIFLPYMSISPSSENTIINDEISKIKKMQLTLSNNNIEDFYNNLITIDNYEKKFELSLKESKNYLNFKNELERLK